MPLSRTMLMLTAATLAAGVAAYAYWPHDRTAQPSERYRTQPADRGNIVQIITANGTLNPVVLVNVGTQVSGTVRKIHADFNDPVKADQVLAELDPALFQAQVKQSEANVLSGQAALELARIKIERVIALQRKNLVAKEELDVARQQVENGERVSGIAQAHGAAATTLMITYTLAITIMVFNF